MNSKKDELKKFYVFMSLCLITISFILASLFTYNKIFVIGVDEFAISFLVRFVIFFILLLSCIILLKMHPVISQFLKRVFTVYEKNEPDFSSIVCGTLVFFFSFHMAIKMPVDYGFHTAIASSLDFRDLKDIILAYSTPLWHIFVRIFNLVFFMPAEYSAALTSSLYILLTYRASLGVIMENAQTTFAKKYAPLFSAMLMFVQPIYLPWFNQHQIYGQGSPNVMHNPTNIAAKPFAIICAYLIIKLLLKIRKNEKIEVAEYVRLSLFLLISVVAKPSAIQVILPTFVIFLLVSLIKSKGKNISICIKMAISCIPSFLWMLFTFYLNFISDAAETSSGITFSFFDVWSAFSNCIPLSILLVTLFPIVEIVVYKKSELDLNKLGIILGIVAVIVGIMEYAFIMETGDRKYHGNFSWGYNIALGILWTFSTSHLLENSDKKDKGYTWGIVCSLFIVHFMCGAYYYCFGTV
ncbi:MAG: hypothetical protein IJW38_05075 [Clostridia bacterium]|nr:hypothetical protein [Clostridia bacterium]